MKYRNNFFIKIILKAYGNNFLSKSYKKHTKNNLKDI